MMYALSPVLALVFSSLIKWWVHRGRGESQPLRYGGVPSIHAALVTSTCVSIAWGEGIHTPEFGIAFCVGIIVIIDAVLLRRHMAPFSDLHYRENTESECTEGLNRPVRKLAHTPMEIMAGMAVGTLVSFF